MSIFIPDAVKRIIGDLPYDLDTTGLSGSQVLMFSDTVLKIEKYRENGDGTVQIMKWLDGKIPVPKVLCHEVCGEYRYLLMSRVTGEDVLQRVLYGASARAVGIVGGGFGNAVER